MQKFRTRAVLKELFPDARVLEQVNIKFAKEPGMRADFVVVKDNKIIGVFEI